MTMSRRTWIAGVAAAAVGAAFASARAARPGVTVYKGAT